MELKVDRREDGIVILTLSREPARNALSSTLVATLKNTMEDLAYDASARVIIITGAGEKAFCAGADLKERRTMSPEQVRRAVPAIQGCFDAVASAPKPVIAAINGFALGGGLELALACDLRVAAEHATLGLPETRLAIIPGAGGTQRLPRLVGLAKAKELIFTGKRLSADEAQAIGLVSRVVDQSELMNAAVELASQMLDAGPVALAQAKFALDEGYGLPLKAGLAVETKAYQVTIPTSDRVEALEAFREKRKPVFRGE